MKRVFRIILGLALIGYAIFSQNAWFFLGVIPLAFGLVNWCPMEKLFGAKCEGGSCACSGSANNETAPKWSTQKQEESSCCAKTESCCEQTSSEPCCANENCIKIEVLGTGCQKCKTLEALVKEVVAPYGDKYCVVKVEDVQKIMSYGITGTPGLVIDGKVVLSGRLPSAEEIRSFLG
jgi:small redox-active disulfide protein 2